MKKLILFTGIVLLFCSVDPVPSKPFPYGDNLLIGTQTGMQIYDIITPSVPLKLSTYQHIYSCDPVVADDNYAYVTLNSNNDWCGRTVNSQWKHATGYR